jgi:hypothetical protein
MQSALSVDGERLEKGKSRLQGCGKRVEERRGRNVLQSSKVEVAHRLWILAPLGRRSCVRGCVGYQVTKARNKLQAALENKKSSIHAKWLGCNLI